MDLDTPETTTEFTELAAMVSELQKLLGSVQGDEAIQPEDSLEELLRVAEQVGSKIDEVITSIQVDSSSDEAQQQLL